jgi:hypothetical protein
MTRERGTAQPHREVLSLVRRGRQGRLRLHGPLTGWHHLLELLVLFAPACSMQWDDHVGDRPAADGGEADSVAQSLTIPSDALLWLSAERGVVTNVDGRVRVWGDQSGWQHDATAPAPATGPRVADWKGRSVLDFDGSTELRLPRLPAFSALSMLAVVRVHAAGADLRCASFLHLANREQEVFQNDYIDFRRQKQELLYQVTDSRIKVDSEAEGSFSTEALHVVSVTHGTDENVLLRIDGRHVGGRPSPLPAFTERSFNFIGHNHYHADANTLECDLFQGQIGELLLFTRMLTDDERVRLERALAAKWRVELW